LNLKNRTLEKCLGLLISNFFILNGEILTKMIQDFSILEKNVLDI